MLQNNTNRTILALTAHMSTMDVKTRFEALSQSAFLDVHLPKTSDFDAGALIRDGSPDDISRAPARRNLFFGTVSEPAPQSPAYSDSDA